MSRSLTRKMFLIALAGELLSILVTILIHSLAPLAATFILLALITQVVAWVGALVKTAELQSWGWFCVLLFTGILGVFVYMLVGPDASHPLR